MFAGIESCCGSPSRRYVLVVCGCGCQLTREWWAKQRELGLALVQNCPDSDCDLELVRCPICGSHRSIEIPRFRAADTRRGMLLAMLPGIAGLGGVA